MGFSPLPKIVDMRRKEIAPFRQVEAITVSRWVVG